MFSFLAGKGNTGPGIELGAEYRFNETLVWSKVTSGESTFSFPENWYTVHARLGVNFVFGNREKKEPLPVNF